MACDICSKTGINLADLQPKYQTDDIKQICSSCEKIVNKHHSHLMDICLDKVKSDLITFMEEKKGKVNKPKRSWISKIFNRS